MAIGQKIKHRRMELGWSQRELARRMGYQNHSTITKIEAEKVDVPQSKITKFSDVLNVPISYLMGWEEVQKKNDVMSDIILKMNEDMELLSIMEALSKLDFEKRKAVKSVLNAFSTTEE